MLQSSESVWCEEVEFTTPKALEFSECAWKECSDKVVDKLKYSADEKNNKGRQQKYLVMAFAQP